jgi:hypothetical protein
LTQGRVLQIQVGVTRRDTPPEPTLGQSKKPPTAGSNRRLFQNGG